MPLRHGQSHWNPRIEHIATASVGLVQSGQHLEHNAQRQKAPAHSTPYLAITIEGNSAKRGEPCQPFIFKYMRVRYQALLRSKQYKH